MRILEAAGIAALVLAGAACTALELGDDLDARGRLAQAPGSSGGAGDAGVGDDQDDGPGGASSGETDTSSGGDGGSPSEESTADAGGGGGGGGGGGSACTAATATSWSFGAPVTARSATMLGRHPRLVPRAGGAGAFWVEQVDGASSLRYAALSASGAVQVGPVEVYRYVAPRPSMWDEDERMFDVAVASSGASFGVVVLDKRDDNLDVWFLDVAGATGAASGLKRITSTSGTPNDWTADLSLDRRGTGFLLLRGDDCSLMGSPGHYCRYLTSLDASGAVVGSASRYVSHPGYHTMGMRLAVLGGTTFMPFKHDNYPAYKNQAYMATVPTPNGGTGTIDPTQVAAGAQVDTALDVAASASTAALA